MLAKQEKTDITKYNFNEIRLQIETTQRSIDKTNDLLAYNTRLKNVVNAIRAIYPIFFDRLGIISNSKLIQHLLDCQKDFTTLIIAIGSNRQSPDEDYNNMINNNTGLFAHDIGVFATHLGTLLPKKIIKVEKITLRDIVDNYPIGTTFDEMRVAKKLEYKPTKYQQDKSKFMLLYLLMHHIRANHFKFIDNDLGILMPLETIYDRSRTLLPMKLLESIHYDGEIQKITKIEGSGDIDDEYLKHTLLIANKIFPKLNRLSIHIHPGVDEFLAAL